jgi:hypothetical protein
MSDAIRDILEGLTGNPDTAPADQIDQAETALNAHILGEVMELIGDDEPEIVLGEELPSAWNKNKLRQELRNKANKKFGGSDE